MHKCKDQHGGRNNHNRGESIVRILKTFLVSLTLIIITGLSIYLIWGWITIEDIRKYCNSKGLDFETTVYEIIPDLGGFEIKVDKNGGSVKKSPDGHELPISRYVFPFTIVDTKEKSASMAGSGFAILLLKQFTGTLFYSMARKPRLPLTSSSVIQFDRSLLYLYNVNIWIISDLTGTKKRT